MIGNFWENSKNPSECNELGLFLWVNSELQCERAASDFGRETSSRTPTLKFHGSGLHEAILGPDLNLH